MKKTLQKTISILLCIVIFVGLSPKISAATYTPAQFNEKLEEVKKMYPQGSQQVDWSVNGSYVGSQCHGYARWLSFYVWGTDFANGSGKGWVRYDSTATTTAIDKLVPGDVLRYRTSANKTSNHSIFVTAIDGETVYFTDCNSDGKSTIKWERSTTKSYLEEHLKMKRADLAEYGYIAHYSANTLTAANSLNITYNLNGGEIENSSEPITEYTIVESDGLNMRKGAGTEYGIVTALPYGTVFTVSETAKDSAGKYVWGKTTYNGKTGWCVISMHWTTKEIISPTPYYTDSDGNVMVSADGSKYNQTMFYGTEYKNGFTKASDFGLYRKDYNFLGWSKTKNGEVIENSEGAIIPEKVFPELKDGNVSATLYAVWQSRVVLSNIEVAALPFKTDYFLMDDFSADGLEIRLNYSDGSQKIITDGFELSGFSSLSAGEQTITVKYENNTTSFTVTVKDYIPGDLNRDLIIDLLDVNLLAHYLAGWKVECDALALDFNADGRNNLLDVVRLAQHVAGWQN